MRTRSVIDENGILLGVTPSDVPYETNEKKRLQHLWSPGNLWMYNKSSNELLNIFGFADADTTDEKESE